MSPSESARLQSLVEHLICCFADSITTRPRRFGSCRVFRFSFTPFMLADVSRDRVHCCTIIVRRHEYAFTARQDPDGRIAAIIELPPPGTLPGFFQSKTIWTRGQPLDDWIRRIVGELGVWHLMPRRR